MIEELSALTTTVTESRTPMRFRFTTRDLLAVSACAAVAASMVRTGEWLLSLGFCIAVVAAIVAMKVRERPDPRFLRVAIFLAIAFATGALVLHVDQLRTSNRSHRDGRTVERDLCTGWALRRRSKSNSRRH